MHIECNPQHLPLTRLRGALTLSFHRQIDMFDRKAEKKLVKIKMKNYYLTSHRPLYGA